MARIRTIKPEIWASPQVMNLSLAARLLFIGLITQADDEGRGVADPRKLKALIFPGDDDVTSARVTALLTEIEREQLAVTYDGNGHGRLYALPSWGAHQRVEKGYESGYPSPPAGAFPEHSRNEKRRLRERSATVPAGSDPIRSEPTLVDPKGSDPARARQAPDAGHAERVSARRPGQLKQSSAEEIERRRRDAAAIAASLAAGAKIPT